MQTDLLHCVFAAPQPIQPLMQRASALRRGVPGMLLLAISLLAVDGLAQNVLIQTGGGPPLTTVTRNFTIPTFDYAPRLSFDIAFATDELPEPNTLFDALAITLQNGALDRALFLSIDAFGLQVKPANPSGFDFDPGALTVSPISYFGNATDPAHRFSYQVSFNVPVEFSGQENLLHIDLFDNGNPVPSVVHAANFTVVPEPGVVVLLAAGALALALFRFRK